MSIKKLHFFIKKIITSGEYMKNIGFEKYSIDIDYTNTSDLIQFVDNMINNYDGNQNILTIQLDKMKASLLHDIDTYFKHIHI